MGRGASQDRLLVKRTLQKLLQSALGLERYLDLFARYRLLAGPFDRGDEAFRAFLGKLPEDGTVLDVGANVGVMTIQLARRVRRGTVVAFEPNPLSHGAAARLLKARQVENVVLHPWALGKKAGDVEMVMPVSGAVRLHGLSHVAGPTDPAGGYRFRAAARVLDEMDELFAPGVRVTGMKIDVEDFESDVIEGARRLLALHRPLVYCELWLTPNRDRTVALMRELGYDAMVCKGGALEPFEPWPHASTQDFFFVPQASA
jgi:FkbM family methyltransferase